MQHRLNKLHQLKNETEDQYQERIKPFMCKCGRLVKQHCEAFTDKIWNGCLKNDEERT